MQAGSPELVEINYYFGGDEMNISNIITNAAFHPNRNAIICGDDGRIFSWLEFESMINKFGNALLKMGVNKGDRVAVYLPNSPEFLFAFFAVARIGAAVASCNIQYKGSELIYILNNSRAKVLLGDSAEIAQNLISHIDKLPHLENIITIGDPVEGTLDFSNLIMEASDKLQTVDCDKDDMVALYYTSGTTGQPKGAMLTHGNVTYAATLNGSTVLLVNDYDLVLTAAPYSNGYFMCAVLGPLCAGAGILTMRRFVTDKALDLISRYQVTHFLGVPTLYIFMLEVYNKDKHNLEAWRFAQAAGAAMPAEYIQQIEKTFGVKYCECYGATETSATISYGRIGHSVPGSVGQEANGTRMKVVDDSGNELPPGEVGEILVKGPGIFKGYWEMPEATKEAFSGEWYHTGDLGKVNENRCFYIVDRKKDMIICGGYNVYPREVEEIIYENPKVLEVAIVGFKDTVRGEIPKAFIKLREGEKMTKQEVIDYCALKLAKYKLPREVEFLDEFPKNPTGKILKRMLQDRA
ncbi:acyl-CoA synthetase (AMP-forming)/AMP-acid ligase II [Desulfoscipio gibsoniae DSM 7213]|uniref:Acyl-CoA synthetase (AMP-forming)/AMP-acid ligase II n=2 Tax=Desulfoscipio gibsoniae TaxID=102134 RepID=R4KA51_9FIRM|nr:acyl-CoA synthetase (AMP-forming)/AMP-acid ligase II [Desulfoscipio gibsoniae DSM 7213]